jgi:Tfp pilus assembly protein PilF
MQHMLKVLTLVCIICIAVSCGTRQANREKSLLHYDIAFDLLQKGEIAQAIEQAQKARELDPKNHEIRNLLGLIYVNRGLLDEAETEFFEALKLKEDYAEVNNNLCGLYISKSLWDKAIDQCKKALSYITYASPDKAYHNLGWAQYKKGSLVESIDSFNQSLKHRPGFYLAHQNLGTVYFDLKKYKVAIDQYQKAVKGCNFCPEPYYRLGLVLFKINKRKTALKSFKKCNELDKEGDMGKLCDNFLKKYKR